MKSDVCETKGTVETTFGDLVEAVTQIAIEAGKTEAEGYRLASLTLGQILSRNRKACAALESLLV